MNAKKKSFKDNEILYLGLTLFLICAIAGLLLGVVYESTKDIISAKKESVAQQAYRSVLSDKTASMDKLAVDDDYQGGIEEIYLAKDASGKPLGYAFKVIGSGYQGDDIEIAVGISSDNKLNGIYIISHSETAGLGAKSTEPEFRNQFIGKSAWDELVATKTGATESNEIDAISGATKTTNGVLNAVNEVLNYYAVHISGAVIEQNEGEVDEP